MNAHTTPKSVLVVEDEFLINLDVAEALRADGFEPVQAYSAEEALAVLHARSDISFVFTDVNLAGKIDGIALASEVQRRWPPIELLVTSGQDLIGRSDFARHDRFVQKPYGTKAVVRRIHAILDAQHAPPGMQQ